MRTTMQCVTLLLTSISMILLSLLFSNSFGNAQLLDLFEGSVCSVNNRTGICKMLENCSSEYENIVKSNHPNLCGFNQSQPIVCCPLMETRSSSTTNSSTTSTSVAVSNYTVGAKAWEKCKQYKECVANDYKLPFGRSTVVGGTKAYAKEFPYMAAIGFGDSIESISWQCGGSLISERYVLSAAHCTWSINGGAATWIRLGEVNLERGDQYAKPQDFRIIENIRHPDYKPPSNYHDIALFKLEKDVAFNDWINPICLPQSSKTNFLVTALGWGQVEWGGDKSQDLLKVQISLISHEKCNSTFTRGSRDDGLKLGIVEKQQLCAGGVGKDTCQGDSGGPLIEISAEYFCLHTLIGVTSLGKVCGGITPGIYTRVYNYVSWIEQTVWPDI